MKSKKVNYGYYGLPILSIMTVIIILISIIIFFLYSKIFGFILICFGLYVLISYLISQILIHKIDKKDFNDILKIEGNEYVLDVGCGLGRMTIMIAKNLKDGKVVGIDIWDKKQLWSNTPEKAYLNAYIEGVREKVEFKYGDVFQIPFPDNTFDLVTCSGLLNNLKGDERKIRALSEIRRVLKPDGKFLLIEPLKSLRMFFAFTPFAYGQIIKKEKLVVLLENSRFSRIKEKYQKGVGFFLLGKSNLKNDLV